jgi:glycosyltransferase involved in cell wall biosynthesis
MKVASGLRVRFVILNLRMGGQVSSILSLRSALLERGVDAELLLPRLARSASKHDLTAYAALPALKRVAGLLALLRGLRELAADANVVLHLVVPSPAFLPILRLLPFPADRTILQCEGPCTQVDREHLKALLEDPALIAPRLILNNRAWMWAGPRSECAHIAPHPAIAAQLRQIGERKIFEIPNSSFLLPEGDGDAPRLPGSATPQAIPGDDDSIWCAYVGHAHPVKGVDDLLEAFAEAATRRPELRLLMALSGDGDAARILRSIAAHGLEERVRLVGLVSIPELLDRVDLLVLPYRSAITTTLYPSLLLEADSARCPVLVAAIPELVPVLDTDSGGVRVFPPRSIQALAHALATTPARSRCGRRSFLLLPTARERAERTVSA